MPWHEVLVIAVLLLTILIAAGVFFFRQHAARQIPAATTSNSPTPVATAIAEKSIAVLPFENLSRDPRQRFFHRWCAGSNPDCTSQSCRPKSD
jgi:hypothetical protein